MSPIPKTQRYYDQRIGEETVFVLPGYHHVSDEPKISISTLLGSCVSACILDRKKLIGGLNHFLLPETDKTSDDTNFARYGVQAMEVLINDLLKRGSSKEDLEAKVFGGATVIKTASNNPVGLQNCNFVKKYLEQESIPITAEDLGGDKARRVYLFPDTGKVSVLRVITLENENVRKKEVEMRKKAMSEHKSGSVELF